jgi:polyphenol oxidase
MPTAPSKVSILDGTVLVRPETRGVAVRFFGRGVGSGPERSTAEQVEHLGRLAGVDTAHLQQTHSATVLPACAGHCGEGDALWTTTPGLALAVVTADCVPVVLAGGGALAVVHAGWRGIAASIVPAALAALPMSAGTLTAWVGPAIGPCCYEVGAEVAAAVVAASSTEAELEGPHGRPHLDLTAAVRAQLEAAGVATVWTSGRCTRCHPEHWHSYRRDGRGGGRNVTLAWLEAPSPG